MVVSECGETNLKGADGSARLVAGFLSSISELDTSLSGEYMNQLTTYDFRARPPMAVLRCPLMVIDP